PGLGGSSAHTCSQGSAPYDRGGHRDNWKATATPYDRPAGGAGPPPPPPPALSPQPACRHLSGCSGSLSLSLTQKWQLLRGTGNEL
ncbi:hypothetical protein NHX12_025617, partial [Muraenolepis orangiensis]